MSNLNPYDTFAGVFVPHFVLSSRRVSPAAKILYALLASGADVRGESLLNPVLLAAKMGVEEGGVLKLVDELVSAWLIKVRQDPVCAEFLSCHFLSNAWQKDIQPPNDGEKESAPRTAPRLLKLSAPTTERSAPADDSSLPAGTLQSQKQDVDTGQGKKNTASRFSKEVCIEYAKARRQAEGKIDNPYALGTAMAKTIEYDEEIELWLRSKGSNQSVA
jgi:hypothetical protein